MSGFRPLVSVVHRARRRPALSTAHPIENNKLKATVRPRPSFPKMKMGRRSGLWKSTSRTAPNIKLNRTICWRWSQLLQRAEVEVHPHWTKAAWFSVSAAPGHSFLYWFNPPCCFFRIARPRPPLGYTQVDHEGFTIVYIGGAWARAPQFSARGNCWRVSTFPTLRAQVRILTAPEASTQRASMQKLRALDNNHATFSHASFTIKRLVKRKLCNLSQTVESYLHLCFCSFRTSADSVSPRFPLSNHGGCFFLAAL